MTDLFDLANTHNRITFARFLHFTLEVVLPQCHLSMWSIYQALLLPRSTPNDPEPACRDTNTCETAASVEDMMVRVEDFWPSLERALRAFECHVPGAVDWVVLERYKAKAREEYNSNKDRKEAPYHCFYDEGTRELVERHDRVVLKRYNYSWGAFQTSSQRWGDCSAVVD